MSARQRKSASRTCPICSSQVPQNVAAHTCAHGSPCRFRLRADGSVLDWKTPECGECEVGATRPQLVLSAKALELFDVPKASGNG